MNVQHKDIPEAHLHEPKGVSSSAFGSVYVADGFGSGTWRKTGADTLKGLSSDGGIAGKRLVSDGTNGFTLITDAVYGGMSMTTNTTNFTTVAAADATLKTTAQFQLLTGTGAPWVAESLYGASFTTDRITVTTAGVYKLNLAMSIKAFPSTTAKVATKFRINGTTFSVRNLIAKSNAAADEEQLSGFAMVTLGANDYVQVMLASNASGSLLINDAEFYATLVRAT